MCVLTPLSVMVLCVSVQAERLKTKVLEAKHQEEKLKMQQRHDADVQKVRVLTDLSINYFNDLICLFI